MSTETRPNRPRGRPPGADSEQTRQRIVWAARDVFRELGYAGTTNVAIATRANLTRPSINYHFDDKRALFRCVVERNAGILAATLGMAELETTLRARLRAVITAVTVDSHVGPAVAFLMAVAIDCERNAELQSEGYEPFDGLRAFLSSSVLDAVRRGEVGADVEVSSVVDAFFAVLSGMALHGGGVLSDGPRGVEFVDAAMLMVAGELFHDPTGV